MKSASQHGLGRAPWCLLLLFLLLTVVASQSSSETSSVGSSTGTEPPSTSPETTAPATTATPIPATTPPATTATPVTTIPATTQTPATTTSVSITPEPSTASTAPTTVSPTPTTASPVTSPSTVTPSPATTTAAPKVEHYNSSTLPPGVNSSVLNGTELVTVEVTETTLGDGTITYDYSIITKSGSTVTTTTLSPATSSSSGSGIGSSATKSKSSSSLGIGAIAGIIAGCLVFMLVLFAFFIAQRRRNRTRASEASADDVLESPVVGNKERLLEPGQGYGDVTRTTATANSRSSGASMPDGRQYRGTMWEDPVILASRIPVDRIELGAVIGRGAFGEVYRGRYRDQDVAIKTLVPEKRKDMVQIEAFLSEVRLIATMEHVNVVPFIGVAWESLSDLYCVTAFMAGGDLRTLLKEYLATGVPKGMDASKMQIAYGVAHALTYLHSLEPVVLHRDLKSRNILLTESLTAMITDFGSSRVRSDATMTSNVGSSLWMAPEVMMGKRYDEKADIFSLGVVISELDTHELPYSYAKEENTISGRPIPDAAVLQMVAMGKLRVRFSSSVHPDLVRFVESCVSVDPRDRPTAAEVLYFLQVAQRDGLY